MARALSVLGSRRVLSLVVTCARIEELLAAGAARHGADRRKPARGGRR